MDLLNFRLFLLLSMTLVGCAQDVLKNDKVKGVLGKKVKFNTTLDGSKPYIAMNWVFLSEPTVAIATITPTEEKIGEPYKDRVTVNKTTGMLELGPLTASDSGQYQLNVIFKDISSSTSELALEVLEPVSNVVITADPAKDVVETNNTVILTCTAKGSFLKYTWLNGTVLVKTDGKRLVLNSDGNILSIKDVQRWDLQKNIYCRAGNDLEEEMSPGINMTVSYGPENVVLTQTPPGAVLTKGSKVTLSCSSVSSPGAKYQWLQNGVAMKDTTASITLDNLNDKNSGNYSCVAFNDNTKRFTASSIATFAVQEPIKAAKITREGAATPLIAKNSTIELTCKAEAGTVASKEWTKDGAPVVTSDRVTISKQKDKLTIVVVQREDAGLYKCILKNDVSRQEGNYTMVVNYGPENMALDGPAEVEIVDPLSIKCTAESFPAAVYTWKLNNTKLASTKADYVVEKPRFRDTGTYTCIARNPLTNQTSTKTHTVYVREEGALDEGLSGGAIAGIIIGVLIALAIVIGVVMHMRKKKDIPSPY